MTKTITITVDDKNESVNINTSDSFTSRELKNITEIIKRNMIKIAMQSQKGVEKKSFEIDQNT